MTVSAIGGSSGAVVLGVPAVTGAPAAAAGALATTGAPIHDEVALGVGLLVLGTGLLLGLRRRHRTT